MLYPMILKIRIDHGRSRGKSDRLRSSSGKQWTLLLVKLIHVHYDTRVWMSLLAPSIAFQCSCDRHASLSC